MARMPEHGSTHLDRYQFIPSESNGNEWVPKLHWEVSVGFVVLGGALGLSMDMALYLPNAFSHDRGRDR
jgi:hypothetical protein